MEEWLVRSLAREYASYHSRSVATGLFCDEESRHEFQRMQSECGRIVMRIQDEPQETMDRFLAEMSDAMERYGVDWTNQ